jgi:hypothetical protein
MGNDTQESAYLFQTEHIGHAYCRKVSTKNIRVRKASYSFSEPVDVGAQALLVG